VQQAMNIGDSQTHAGPVVRRRVDIQTCRDRPD
jgi:hypothetical protein